MKKELMKRKYNGEVYTYYLHEHDGSDGILGVPQYSYVSCETPDNGLGYTDTVLLNNGIAYTLHRYLQPWILEKIRKKMSVLENKYC